MATLKERSDNWNATSLITRDNRHDKSAGYEETPHKKNKARKAPKKKPGCPGNDGKNHVYVWTLLRWEPGENGKQIDRLLWKSYYRSDLVFWTLERHQAYLESYEVEVCAGCYKKRRIRKAQ
jgi:hypothetical protein